MRPAHGSDILLLGQAVFGCPLRYVEVFIPGARRSDLIEPHSELSAVSYQFCIFLRPIFKITYGVKFD